MPYNVSFISLGCAKNQVNCEQMMALCAEAGYSIQAQPEGCDVVVVNTCGFLASACEEAIENILEMAELKKAGRLDLVSLDCTGGVRTGWRDGHMCLETDLEVFRRMEKEKIADERTIKVINHFSHNGGATYDELAAEAAKYGVVVSFDGLEIEF